MERKRKTTIDICRKGSIVKEKCRQLTEIAFRLFPEGELSRQDLRDMVEDYWGSSKETIRSYLGYRGQIRQRKRGGGAYIFGEAREGYLKKFGFMHEVGATKWRINQHALLSNSSLKTTDCKSPSQNESIKNPLFVSGLPQGEGSEGNRFEKVPLNGEADRETNNNTEKRRDFRHEGALGEEALQRTTSREAGKEEVIDGTLTTSQSSESERLGADLRCSFTISGFGSLECGAVKSDVRELAPEVKAIMSAIPVDGEPDRAKIMWENG
jgi:hypothetical protein